MRQPIFTPSPPCRVGPRPAVPASQRERLVESGRARADIFDKTEAQKFNNQLVHRQVEFLRQMNHRASWIVDLLQQLEAASKPLAHLYRLLKDGSNVAAEARFWADLEHAQAAAVNRHRKDATDMVFHKAFLSGTKYIPNLLQVVEGAVTRILARVDIIQHESSSKHHAPSKPGVFGGHPSAAFLVSQDWLGGRLWGRLGLGGSSKWTRAPMWVSAKIGAGVGITELGVGRAVPAAPFDAAQPDERL